MNIKKYFKSGRALYNWVVARDFAKLVNVDVIFVKHQAELGQDIKPIYEVEYEPTSTGPNVDTVSVPKYKTGPKRKNTRDL